MIQLILNGNDYHYSIEQLLRVFLPDIELLKVYDSPSREGEYILCETEQTDDALNLHVSIHTSFSESEFSQTLFGDDLYKAGELSACQFLYKELCHAFRYTPQWGIQTGVRPTKIYFNLLRNNSEEQAVKYLREQLFISQNKVNLVKKVCQAEVPVITSAKQDEFSLYISIPFCPSRCSYCSFISHSYHSIKKLIPEYMRLLSEEIEQIAAVTKELCLRLRTVYIGGGTPTVLDEKYLRSIFDTIQKNFDLSSLTEFTLEAGRPDTLTKEKLALIRSFPVTRLTINAQSFNDDVLKAIGRNHTCEDVHTAYTLAREAGFHNINTDLIAGLEGESVDSFLDSLSQAIQLGAENITIHTLALKRSSFLITRDNAKGQIESQTAAMIEKASAVLEENGYIPYYMYRQSKSVGNLENTGWCKPGKECEYNIFMMEEVQNVFGAGAGAVTRLTNPADKNIARVFNYKYPYEYISGFENIIERKSKAKQIVLDWREP